MLIAYLDIETYSPEEPKFSNKIILICYKEVLDGNVTIMFKEWLNDEETMLKRFYGMLNEKLLAERIVMLIGWNILRFDVPFLTYRIYLHEIDDLENILEAFREVYWRDLRQCLLPFNRFSFKGLSMDEVSKKLKISPPKYSNKDIKLFYERGEYEKIEEHTLSEMRFLSELCWKMKNLREIAKAFKVVI